MSNLSMSKQHLDYLFPNDANDGLIELGFKRDKGVTPIFCTSKAKALEIVQKQIKDGSIKAVWIKQNLVNAEAIQTRYEDPDAWKYKAKTFKMDALIPYGLTAGDNEILRVENFYIDIDVKRETNTNSTEHERSVAYDTAKLIQKYLTKCGFPSPVFLMSGNGYHLLYKFPDATVEQKKAIFESVAEKFTKEIEGVKIEIDQKVYNDARYGKLAGTPARKGPHTDERPQRDTEIVEFPKEIKPILVENIKNILKKAPKTKKQNRNANERYDVPALLQSLGISLHEQEDLGDHTRYFCDPPEAWKAEYSTPYAPKHFYIGQHHDTGEVFINSFHDSDTNRKWTDFKRNSPMPISRRFGKVIDSILIPSRRLKISRL